MYWLITILSALLYGSAFYLPILLGWAVIPSLILNAIVIAQHTSRCSWLTCKSIMAYALTWGMVAYGILHWWVYLVIRTHSNESIMIAFAMYFIFTVMFASTVVLWWLAAWLILCWIQSRLLQVISYLITTIGYFFLLDRYGGLLSGQLVGYPILSPLIPLASYKSFLWMIAYVSGMLWPGHHYYRYSQTTNPLATIHFHPIINKRNESVMEHLKDQVNLAHVFYHKLRNFDCSRGDIIVTPESTFAHCLNECEEFCGLWGNVLPQEQHFLLGAQYKGKQRAPCQAIFHIHKNRITNFYVKKHLVPFGECPHPLFSKKEDFAESGQSQWMEIDEDAGSSILNINDWVIIPRICSEFLALYGIEDYLSYRIDLTKKTCVMFFVNDSWFDQPFVDLIHLYTALRAAWIGLPIAYVGHDECVWF